MDGKERKAHSIGAMDERARKVQKASTHSVCCVAANGASVKCDGAGIDGDAAALHSEKEMSEFNGALKWGRRL